jgi:hypothetical protein
MVRELARNKVKKNGLTTIYFSILGGFLGLVLVMFLENILGIKINQTLIYMNLVLVTGTVIWALVRAKVKINIPELVLVLIIFYFSFYARVSSVRFFNAPPLHDPVNHAITLAKLLDSGTVFVDTWYPPGLNYFSAYVAVLSGLDTAKTILLVTNFFNALFPISIYFILRALGTEILGALMGFILAFVLKIPFELFYTAGKNSPIMFVALFPSLIWYYVNVAKKNSYWFFGILGWTFSLFLVHYPLSMLLDLLFLIYVIFVDKPKVKGKIWQWGLALGLIVMVLFLWWKRIGGIISVDSGSGITDLVLNKKVETTLSLYVADVWGQIKFYVGGPLFGLYLLMGFYLAGRFIKKSNKIKKKCGFLYLVSASWMVVIVLLAYILNRLGLLTLAVFLKEEFYMFLTLIIMLGILTGMAVFLREINIKFVEKAVLILILLFLGWKWSRDQYWLFYNVRELDVITSADIKGFEYLNSIYSGGKVLINNHFSGVVIAGSDSGMWLPAYYPRIEVSPRNFRMEYEVNKVFEQLFIEPKDPKTYARLKELGFKYIFLGSKSVWAKAREKYLLKNSFYRLVYDDKNTSLAVFEIK